MFSRFIYLMVLCTLHIPMLATAQPQTPRERISFNQDWRFFKYANAAQADSLIYDVRPQVNQFDDTQAADSKPTDAVDVEARQQGLKPWILPISNAFIADPTKHHQRPPGHPGSNFAFVQREFDDSQWQRLNLPHDWAINGPFFASEHPAVGGGMGRLPSPGIGWYRKTFSLPKADAGKRIYLDIDGAMAYSVVWLNGKLVGGWPYGYSSYRLDLTPYLTFDKSNQLAIRLDNPPDSSRWYPGGGIYRNVWLVKTPPIHVAHWGTKVTTKQVSPKAASVSLAVTIEHTGRAVQPVTVINKIALLDDNDTPTQDISALFPPSEVTLEPGQSSTIELSTILKNPQLWGPKPTQVPHRYVVITQLMQDEKVVDEVHTPFGVRTLTFDPDHGLMVNGERIKLQGVNQHHDLGALGAAFNVRAAQRQLELLQQMGVNALRVAHNPPAPELLTLTDKMGILVLNESFDVWFKKKTPLDFHLIFADWHEQDLRAVVRRDRNHPSVIGWFIGNEVGEQYTGEAGAEVALKLKNIVHQEDGTRPVTASMNWAKADSAFSAALDLISLNYQGEGIRQEPMFEGTERIRTPPSYPAFHEAHPNKVILSSETASAFSSRGIYLFPVTAKISSPVRHQRGGDDALHQVSSYELYSVDFGSSADRVFRYQDENPFVAGEFVWNGFDYLGEPTPYYAARSSYSGMIDLAGFKKDRFYLYQSRWRPNHPMVHILPHWNWPDRKNKVTPVHVFTSGDEVELFINGQSQGRKKKGPLEYRLRFDDVTYSPGVVEAVAYKNGAKWAQSRVETTGKPVAIKLSSDTSEVRADGQDLAFITVEMVDAAGRAVPTATNKIAIKVEGAGELVATDNGDATDFTSFNSASRHLFSGKALAIIRAKQDKLGPIKVEVSAEGLSLQQIILDGVP